MISHFEVSGGSPEPLIEFYSELLGWRFEEAPGVEGYWLIQTPSKEGEHGELRPVNGGMLYKTIGTGLASATSV